MRITIEKGKAIISEQLMLTPLLKKVYLRDKSNHKPLFEIWMRFVFFAYDKKSVYYNYLPKERERKVLETIFPEKDLSFFKGVPGLKQFIEYYIEIQTTFKERLYRRLLNDIEEMMDKLSKIELTKTTRVKGSRDITFFSKTEKKEVTENIDIDVRLSIDNSDEKIKAMDILDKLLKREVLLKKALKAERIEDDLRRTSERRMFD